MTDQQRDKLLDFLKLLGVLIILAEMVLIYFGVSRMKEGDHIHWEGVAIVAIFTGVALVLISPDKFSEVLKVLAKKFTKDN